MVTTIEEQLQQEQSIGCKKVNVVCIKPVEKVYRPITLEREYEAVYGWVNKSHETDQTNDFFMLRNDKGTIETYAAEHFKIVAIAI